MYYVTAIFLSRIPRLSFDFYYATLPTQQNELRTPWSATGGHLYDKIKMAKSPATDRRFLCGAARPPKCVHLWGADLFVDRCGSFIFGEDKQELALDPSTLCANSLVAQPDGRTSGACPQPGG